MTTEAIELFKSVVAEKRYIQGEWHKGDYVCLAAAWGKPGTINDIVDCPANLFPRWIFELMPALDDCVNNSEVPWLFQGFADRAERMAQLTPDQWEIIRKNLLIGIIDIAVNNASSCQLVPALNYWIKVTEACKQVQEALKGNGDLAAARAAARAAEEAAAEAASPAVAWAAGPAAWAARAAARAAGAPSLGTAWAARAARAAGGGGAGGRAGGVERYGFPFICMY